MKTKSEQLLERAVCNLLMPPAGQTAQPFFASLCMELTRVPVNEAWFAKLGMSDNMTAATDGRKLYYYPPFIESLSPDLVKSLLVHEVYHCALSHPFRVGGRDPKLSNIAQDFVVNELIEKECKLPLGPDWLRSQKFDGLAWEEVYARFQKKPKGGKGDGEGQGGNGQRPGEVIDCSKTGNDPGVMAKEWETKLVNAANLHKGSVPAQFQVLIDEILNPKVPWQTLLRRFIQSVAKADYSWARPDRRHVWNGLYLPSLRSDRIGSIAFAIDTSGSTSEYWGNFLDESQAVLDQTQPEKLLYFQCDCAVGVKREYLPGDTIERAITGTGGSSTVPVFDSIAAEYEHPLCLVYLTDGYIDYPEQAPAYPVLWIVTNTEQTPPWGEVVRL